MMIWSTYHQTTLCYFGGKLRIQEGDTIHLIACVTGVYLDWREARDIELGTQHTSACPKCEDGSLKECILARGNHTLVSQGQLARVCLNTIR